MRTTLGSEYKLYTCMDPVGFLFEILYSDGLGFRVLT